MSNIAAIPRSSIIKIGGFSKPRFTTILLLAGYDGLMEMTEAAVKSRQPGRPRAILKKLESVLIRLYESGHGYRAIARILRLEYRINPHFSSIRKTLMRLGKIQKEDTTP